MTQLLRILYVGDDHPHSTSRQRANAFRRIGCDVELLNPASAYSQFKLHPKINYMSGYQLVAPLVKRWLKSKLCGKQFELAIVDGGLAISSSSVAFLHQHCTQIANYVIDDPTGLRDGNNWNTLRGAIADYDLWFVVRIESEQEFRHRGARKVVRIWRSYDEVAHAPFPSEQAIPQSFRSEVAFIGTWMKDEGRDGRDYFLLKLIEAGVPVSIWGGRWFKSPCWSKLKPFWRGGSLGGRDYVAAIQGAKITLGFLSKGNRDLHTQRSSEIPYIGGLLCAERTSEHLQMYQEGVEAVFWSSAEECIEVCRELLPDETKRRQITAAGMHRIKVLGLGNETICRKMLCELGYSAFQNSATSSLFRMQSAY
jgi:spore maturation protein CgeB